MGAGRARSLLVRANSKADEGVPAYPLASEARRSLCPLVKKVNEDHDAIEIVSKHGNAVLVSAEDYSALRGGAYLLRSPANARHLLKAYENALNNVGLASMNSSTLRRIHVGWRRMRLVFEDQGWRTTPLGLRVTQDADPDQQAHPDFYQVSAH